MDVAVIGAGIGGLSVALALQKVGIHARVYEQAPEIGAVGAGVGLWPGALRSLREIGVADAFWELPVCRFRWAETATSDGRPITGFDVSAMTGGLGYVVRRSDLHAALRAPLAADAVLTGRQLTAIQQDPAGVDLQFADGSGARAEVVIGADGLNSVVRTALLGFAPPRYSGETAYRGLTGFAVDDPGMMRELQGAGHRGAVHPIDDRTAYWWATRRAPQGRSETAAERKEVLLGAFAGWAGGLPEAIAATPAAAILKNDLCDRRPVSKWSDGRVTLLGDAAHPTTPNLGLGGCMAIEDALVLARAFRENSGYGPALAQYEFERHARAAEVVKMSRLMGRFGSIRNPALARGWRVANRLTPTRVAAGMLAREVTFEPGQLVR